MLQQTQVDRVLPYYRAFIKKFPTVQMLAEAQLPEVLSLWQGLGYNRRARYARDAARAVLERHGGKMPRTVAELMNLPGVGPYTARAVAAFAHNDPEVFIETNIRTVFIHHCFADTDRKISDDDLVPLIAEALTLSHMEPRHFYAALMDYGAYLKKSGLRLNARSSHYLKQSKFEGSRRQLRGAILRELLRKPQTLTALAKKLSKDREAVEEEVARLFKEKIIQGTRGILRIVA